MPNLRALLDKMAISQFGDETGDSEEKITGARHHHLHRGFLVHVPVDQRTIPTYIPDTLAVPGIIDAHKHMRMVSRSCDARLWLDV